MSVPATEPGSNKQRSLAFRNEVLLYLLRQGLSQADTRPEGRGLSEHERWANDTGDIVGLSWAIGVRNQRDLDLGTAMAEIEREADRAGKELFASIQRRKGHPIESAYVTMPLSAFVAVLHASVTPHA